MYSMGIMVNNIALYTRNLLNGSLPYTIYIYIYLSLYEPKNNYTNIARTISLYSKKATFIGYHLCASYHQRYWRARHKGSMVMLPIAYRQPEIFYKI